VRGERDGFVCWGEGTKHLGTAGINKPFLREKTTSSSPPIGEQGLSLSRAFTTAAKPTAGHPKSLHGESAGARGRSRSLLMGFLPLDGGSLRFRVSGKSFDSIGPVWGSKAHEGHFAGSSPGRPNSKRCRVGQRH
jgi:hypothetical protein